MHRKVSASREATKKIKAKGIVKVSSDIPVDPYGCACRKSIINRKKHELNKRINCPRRTEKGMKQYEVFCSRCHSKVGDIYSIDKKLTDWCDFHYYCESREIKGIEIEKIVETGEVYKKGKNKGKPKTEKVKTITPNSYQWFGAMAIQLSPFDGKLGIECTCGQDTRDFRGNTTLPVVILEKIIDENMKGRDFGEKGSKFYLK